MIVPAPPPKYVQSAEELVIGETYHIDSRMGGVWVITYKGMDKSSCVFEYENSEMAGRGPIHMANYMVHEHIRIRQDHFDTFEEWRAAGGRWPEEKP